MYSYADSETSSVSLISVVVSIFPDVEASNGRILFNTVSSAITHFETSSREGNSYMTSKSNSSTTVLSPLAPVF